MGRTLGDALREAREAMGLGLRDVERRTDGRLKSGYLSQLERGGIRQPTPESLWRLAELYGLDYAYLMEKAGHRLPSARTKAERTGLIAGIPIKALEELDERDQEELRQFVGFLHQRERRD